MSTKKKKKKSKLSKGLRNMKFMKRKSNSKKRKTKQNDKKAKIEAMQWIQSEASESNLIIDDRRDEYMMYRTGRKSFGDFNVSVQKMEQESIQIIKEQSNQQKTSETALDTNKKNKKRNLNEANIEIQRNDNKRQKLNDSNHNKKIDDFIKPQPLK